MGLLQSQTFPDTGQFSGLQPDELKAQTRSGDGGLDRGETDRDGGALAGSTFNADSTAMAFDDLTAGRKAKAAAPLASFIRAALG